MKLELSDQEKRELCGAIQRFFDSELDEDIGDLRATLVMDFMLAQIAPTVYRRAILDAQAHLQEKLLDMEAVLYLDG